MRFVSKTFSFIIMAVIIMQNALPTAVQNGVTVYASETRRAPQAPYGLLTNEFEEPMNVETPYFSWLVNDEDESDIQSAYRVIVTDMITAETAWDSGKVNSSEQSYIECGTELKAGYPYSWKVMTWDCTGLESEWSDDAYFATGLDTADWGASWICSGGSGSNHYWYSRYEMELDSTKTVAKALAYFAGVHDYELNVNGTYIGRGQSFDYASETRYQGWDVTDAIDGQTLVIGLMNRYYGGGQGRAESREALLGHINIYYTDGSSDTIVTDADWLVSEAVPLSGSSKRNSEGDFVEEYDARAEQTGYSEPGFDASGWNGAYVIGAHPTDEFTSVTAELSRITDYIVKPVSVTKLEDGTVVADFGTIIPARPVIDFQNGVEGRRIAIQTGYELMEDGHADTSSVSTQSTDMRYIYTQRDGAQTYDAWDHLGFRYISVPECGENFTEDTITARVVHTNVPEERDSTLVTSNEMLNAVYDMMKRSALYSIQNSFVDTPTREKGQFLQDSINISDASVTTLYERAASKKAIDQFLASADRYWTGDEAGRYNSVYPNGDGKRDIPDFTINLPYWVWSYYMQTGDRSTLEKAYPYIKATADYITGNISDDTGLVTQLAGGDGSPNSYQYGIVDWPAVGRFGYDWSGTKNGARTTVNMLSKRAFDVIGLAAAELGYTADAEDMAARSGNLKTAINERLINSNGVYCDGLDASGVQVSHASQHVTSYALAFDIASESMRTDMAEYVASMGMQQGPMTADILAKALFRSGEYAAALKLFTEPNDNGWAKEISKGYTFTWESWNADSTENSQSHGWGAAAAKDMLEGFAGVTITEPGASRVRIEPAYCALTSLDASVSTERGNVGVSYSRSDTRYDITVTVPTNMTAELVLPRIGESKFVRQNGSAIESELTERGQVFLLGGGTYVFSYDGDITTLPEDVVYEEPLPEGISGLDNTENATYTWSIGASDTASQKGTIYEETNNYADLVVSLGKGDRLDAGIILSASSVREPTTNGQASLADTKRYIVVTAKCDGTLSMSIAFDSASGSKKNRIYYADLGEDADMSAIELSSYSKGSHSVIDGDITTTAETVKSLNMTAGHTYIIYTYQSGCTISALSYKYTEKPEQTEPPCEDSGLMVLSRTVVEDRLDYKLSTGTNKSGMLAAASYNTDGSLYDVTVKEFAGSETDISVNIPKEQTVTVKLMIWDGIDTMRSLSGAVTDEYTAADSVVTLDRTVYPPAVGNKDKTDFSDHGRGAADGGAAD